MNRKAYATLLGAAAVLVTSRPAMAGPPDLWPDYRHTGTERISAFKPGVVEIRRTATGAEIPGSRQTLRRNERDVPMRVSEPTQNKFETFEVKDAPTYSTKVHGRIQITLSHTKVAINRLDWTETPYVDYTVHKWEQWDAFQRRNSYASKRVARWRDEVSGRELRFEGPESNYDQTDDDRTWPPVAAEDKPVEVGRGILKTGKIGPTLAGTRVDIAEASRRSLASVSSAGAGQLARGAYGFRGDQGNSVVQARVAGGQATAASLGSRNIKAAATARGNSTPQTSSKVGPAVSNLAQASGLSSLVVGGFRPAGISRPADKSTATLIQWANGIQGQDAATARWRELVGVAAAVTDSATRMQLAEALEDNVNTAKDLGEALTAIGRIGNAASREKAQSAYDQIKASLGF